MTFHTIAAIMIAAHIAPPGGSPDPMLHEAQSIASGTIQAVPDQAPERDYIVGFSCRVAENSQGWFTDLVIERDRGGEIPDGVTLTWIVPLAETADTVVTQARGRGVALRLRNVLPFATEPTAGCIIGQ